MPEIRQPMQMVMIDYECDKCGKGAMRYTGRGLQTGGPVHPQQGQQVQGLPEHRCTNSECGHTQLMRKQYPLQVMVPVPMLETFLAGDEEQQPGIITS